LTTLASGLISSPQNGTNGSTLSVISCIGCDTAISTSYFKVSSWQSESEGFHHLTLAQGSLLVQNSSFIHLGQSNFNSIYLSQTNAYFLNVELKNSGVMATNSKFIVENSLFNASSLNVQNQSHATITSSKFHGVTNTGWSTLIETKLNSSLHSRGNFLRYEHYPRSYLSYIYLIHG